ncbi:VWA domain-containing protein [Chelatococcus reniformis]|uniref:Transporter n=1 Tax=Chelatococcus reniformis TaxID=1494448 RepID=A0A916UN76_9HYPH|nr:VWA domain-containing protein [Chelatococcus reniformis]GGC79439.1 transporter [Chelatococcus reniformis]
MNDLLAHLHLLRPWWLLLLVPALVLWWIERRASDSTAAWAKVMDADLLAVLRSGGERRSAFARADVLLAGWILGIVAIAGPTWRELPQPFAAPSPPAMVVLKVASSMLTPDLSPTRLDRARQKLADLMAARPGAATGLVAYGGSAHLVLPPTPDKDVVATMAGALSPQIMPVSGDALAKAVALASDVLRRGQQGGAVLIVTDTVAPDQVAELAGAAAGVPTVIFAVVPPANADRDTALAAAARALSAPIVETTPDEADVARMVRRLAAAPQAPAPGEAARWQEAGYWLTPIIALIALGWFRRGWVLG